MSDLAVVTGVCGGPIAWAGWALVAGGQAIAPDRWARGAALAGAGMVPVALWAADGNPLALVVAMAVWAASLCRVGALAGSLTRGRWRALAGAGLGASFGGLELAARWATGGVGGVLDGLAPGPGLGRAALGALDASTLVTLALPGFAAAAVGRWWSARGLVEEPNARTTAMLVPLAGVLSLTVLPSWPPLFDGSERGTLGMHEATVGALHRIDRPLLVSVLHGGALSQADREVDRGLGRLFGGLRRAALQQVSLQTLGEAESAEVLAGAGETLRGGRVAVQVRALDRSRVLFPPGGPDLQEAVAEALWELGGPEQRVVVLDEDGAGSLDGAAAVVLGPGAGALPEETLRALDRHVVGGGGLLALYGSLDDRAQALTAPWGLGPDARLRESRAVSTWAGFDGLLVPRGALRIVGPDGLAQTVAHVLEQPVAVAVQGVVPSAFGVAGGTSARLFLSSASVTDTNPGMAARALDWVLDRQQLAPLRARGPARAPRPGWAMALLALLPGALVMLGTRGGEP